LSNNSNEILHVVCTILPLGIIFGVGSAKFTNILHHEGKGTVNEMVNNYYHKQKEFFSFEENTSKEQLKNDEIGSESQQI
jgi:hypothetical protein